MTVNVTMNVACRCCNLRYPMFVGGKWKVEFCADFGVDVTVG